MPTEDYDQHVSRERRREEITEIAFENPAPFELEAYISKLVYNAYLAGAKHHSPVPWEKGLQEEERQAREHCRFKGLTPP